MAYGSWRISTRSGDLVPVRVADGVDVRVGDAQAELDRAPGSSLVTLLDGDGELTPTLLDIEFLAKGAHPNDVFGARQALRNLEAALREADALWGAGPYEGLYLPLLEAFAAGKPLENGGREFRLPYNLVSASVKRNVLADAWAYPILDDVSPEDASTAFYTSESEPGAPILAFTPASRWSAPVSFAAMPQGTMYVGGKSQDLTWSLGSVGTPISGTGVPSSYATGVFYNQGQYRAHAGITTFSVPQDNAGGFGYLVMFAMSWAEYGRLSLASFSRFGFRDHGSVAIGEIEPLTFRRLYAGTRIDGVGVDGFIMPGAPQFGAPFATHRVHSTAEKRAALEAWYLNNARDVYLIPPPPYGLEITVGLIPDLVTGRTVQIPLTVTRRGGFLGEIEFIEESSNPSLRLGDTVVVGRDSEGTYNLPVTAEEGIAAGEYTVMLTVRAVGQNTSSILKDVIDTETFAITVRLGDPALPEGTLAFDALYDPQNKSFATMNKNSAPGGVGRTWTLQGLTSYTSRWDGLRGDGSDTTWGKATATIDSYVTNMAADHTVSRAFWNVNAEAVGTVLFTLASQTNKFDYWQVYKTSTGVKIRTSAGTTTSSQVESGQALPILSGVMDVSVVVTGGNVTLVNPKTLAKASTPSRAWVGAGRLTAFGAKLSDGTVQGLSKGITLVGAVQERAVSDFQLERQAEYFRGFMLRTAQWDRPEYPPFTFAAWLGDTAQTLRNYHPATASQTMISKGTGAVVTGGSFVTNGALETGWRTGWIANSDASKPNDIIFAMKDMQVSPGIGLAKFGLSFYNNSNNYFRFGANSSTTPRFYADYRLAGETTVQISDTGLIPISGVQAFCQRLDPVAERVAVEHIASGQVIDNVYGTWTLAGNFQATIGATHRGLDNGAVRGDGTTGLEFEAAADCLGIIMVARHATTQERKDAAAIIITTPSYALAPTGGGGSGVSAPPPSTGGGIVVAASDMTAVAIPTADWNISTLFGSSGAMRDQANRLKVEMDKGGYGNLATTEIYKYTDTSHSIRGQYHIARKGGHAGLRINFALRCFKHLNWAKQSQTMWNNIKRVFDTATGPESTSSSGKRGHAYGTMPDGGGTDNSYGKRTKLEAGVMSKVVVHAYNLHLNVHLDSTFAASRDEIMDWYLNDHIAEWDTYYGQTSASPGGAKPGDNPTMGDKPLHVKKNFTHPNMSEIVAEFVVARIRLGANWFNDPSGIEALNAWALWYQTNTTAVIPVANFRFAEWASYGPARMWGQRALGWGPQNDPQFTQSQTYLNETWDCLMFLYLEGFLTRALGTQAAADTFMVECVSGSNLGVYIEPLLSRGLVAGALNGYLAAVDSPTGVAGPHMFTTNPFGGNKIDYQSEDKILKGYNILSALDASNRLTTIQDNVMSRYKGALDGSNSEFRGGNIDRLFATTFKNGRKG